MKESASSFVSEMNAWHGRTIGIKTIEALKRNRFDAGYFETGVEAADVVMNFIQPGATVAFGGSQTIKQLGLPERIHEAGAIILDHNAEGLDPEEKMEIMRRQQVCDVFICSSNAISLDGQLFNVDGNGNRLSAMIFGPKKVIVLAGVNKICINEEQAWERIRSIAAPVNLKRLNRPNPCTKEGICADCNLPTRGCNAYLALRKKPTLTDFSVFIINEMLGF
jgi:hypothetical protein